MTLIGSFCFFSSFHVILSPAMANYLCLLLPALPRSFQSAFPYQPRSSSSLSASSVSHILFGSLSSSVLCTYSVHLILFPSNLLLRTCHPNLLSQFLLLLFSLLIPVVCSLYLPLPLSVTVSPTHICRLIKSRLQHFSFHLYLQHSVQHSVLPLY